MSDGPTERLEHWLPALLRAANPLSQHFLFIHRVLGEPLVDSLVMAVFARKDQLLTEAELRYIAQQWT